MKKLLQELANLADASSLKTVSPYTVSSCCLPSHNQGKPGKAGAKGSRGPPGGRGLEGQEGAPGDRGE